MRNRLLAALRERTRRSQHVPIENATAMTDHAADLFSDYQRTGRLDLLNAAVELFHNAVAATRANHPDHPECLSNLGAVLCTRFKHTGQLADLDEAITAGRDAVAATEPDHPDRPTRLSNLGAALQTRFGRMDQLADIDAAVDLFRDAVGATPRHYPDHPAYLSNLVCALQTRFERTGQLADLDEAITVGRDAVTATPPDHPNYRTYLLNLGVALRNRFQRTGQQADLDEAVAASRDVVAATPADHPNRPACLSSLGLALHTLFRRTGQLTDLDEAVAVGREAVATTPPDHPNRPRYLSNLGLALRGRFACTGQQAALDEAITAFRGAVGVESGPPAVRMRAGQVWGMAAIDAGRVDSAADGFASALGLLPLVAWHGLSRVTREQHLTDWGGLAADAAACAIRAGRPERAVELLEAGRSVLWAQILNLRTDLTDLTKRAPDLATRLDQVRTLLDAPLPVTTTEAMSSNVGDPVKQLRAAQNRAVEDRVRLAREFDDLLIQVRALDGFEHFLAPTPYPATHRGHRRPGGDRQHQQPRLPRAPAHQHRRAGRESARPDPPADNRPSQRSLERPGRHHSLRTGERHSLRRPRLAVGTPSPNRSSPASATPARPHPTRPGPGSGGAPPGP